jgi:hypothetical protein
MLNSRENNTQASKNSALNSNAGKNSRLMFLDYVVQMKYQQMQHATRYNLCKVKHF